MNILLCGARGFIGSHLRSALEAAGHRVTGGVSAAWGAGPHDIVVDYARDTDPAIWLPRLQGIEVVVNAVGVLRDSPRRPIAAVHTATPQALFEACAQAGVPQVIHVSALGIEYSTTRYARTKLAAERHLGELRAQGRLLSTILRPSIVFGKGGDSSALFLNLARLPVALLPGPVIDAQIQPVAVTDLAEAVAALIGLPQPPAGPLPCVGPEPVLLGDFIASLRKQLGHGPAHVVRLPDALTTLSAQLGDWVPASPWSSEAVELLQQNNTAPPAEFEALIGHPGAHFSTLLKHTWH